MFGVQNLQWFGYLMVEMSEVTITCFDVTDGGTSGHRMTA